MSEVAAKPVLAERARPRQRPVAARLRRSCKRSDGHVPLKLTEAPMRTSPALEAHRYVTREDRTSWPPKPRPSRREPAARRHPKAQKRSRAKKTRAEKLGAPHETKHAAKKASYALEAPSKDGRVSRKSTRSSANRAKPDSNLTLREQRQKGSPTARARKARARASRVRAHRRIEPPTPRQDARARTSCVRRAPLRAPRRQRPTAPVSARRQPLRTPSGTRRATLRATPAR